MSVLPTTCRPTDCGIDDRAPDARRVGDVGGDHRPVVDHVGVGVAVPLVVDRARARRRRALERGEHTLLQRLQRLDGRRADDPLHRGLGGHDVGLVAALGDDAVDPLGRADVLAQRGDVHVAEHRCVERVASLLRRRRGVRGLAVVLHVQLLQRDASPSGSGRRRQGAPSSPRRSVRTRRVGPSRSCRRRPLPPACP